MFEYKACKYKSYSLAWKDLAVLLSNSFKGWSDNGGW